MKTVRLDQILRQRDPDLKEAVGQLARGEIRAAVDSLDRQRRVHEFSNREERIAAIAREYARSPESTLVVSPDNRSRAEINLRIHGELQSRGVVGRNERAITTLVPRQEMTGADRTWAVQYQVDDIVRYSRASRETGIGKGEYARVTRIEAEKNLLTVARADGSERTYDPRRQMGVTVFREQEKMFSQGDRIQFTAPNNDLKIANRELGTVEGIASNGTMKIKLDNGQRKVLDPTQYAHLDHGYAVTSHSSQGQTADRVLIHVDTGLAAKELLNNRMAYVAVSRGQCDAQIFTNDRGALVSELGRDVSHLSAYQPQQAIAPSVVRDVAQTQERELGPSMGMGLGT
jgi:ATP-dependent exoDNAse (exonuclease V) alpha subunit